jgi:cytidylate kinase
VGSLLLVTGPPGAGKSTVARAVADRWDRSVLVEGDAFFAFLRRGAVPPWRPGSASQNDVVTRAAAAATGRFAAGGYDVVYDGVVGPWLLPAFLAATGLERLHYVVLLPPVEECVARVGGRRGHGFRDPAATRHMHRELADAAVDRRHVIDDPGPDVPALVARILAAAAEGVLVHPDR